jgi:3-hydroxyacyl-[acyl-carrier-protein] dehydratase
MLEKFRRMATIAQIMRFILIDKIVEIETGKRIKAIKSVSLAEEYLADHFPAFPVLPGVLLLEGLIESASWLVRATENFSHSMVLLEEAKNVRYKSFLAPGMQIEYSVEAKTIEENISSFTGTGVSNGEQIVEARFGLRHFNLAEKDSSMAAIDAQIIGEMKKRWKLLKK